MTGTSLGAQNPHPRNASKVRRRTGSGNYCGSASAEQHLSARMSQIFLVRYHAPAWTGEENGTGAISCSTENERDGRFHLSIERSNARAPPLSRPRRRPSCSHSRRVAASARPLPPLLQRRRRLKPAPSTARVVSARGHPWRRQDYPVRPKRARPKK